MRQEPKARAVSPAGLGPIPTAWADSRAEIKTTVRHSICDGYISCGFGSNTSVATDTNRFTLSEDSDPAWLTISVNIDIGRWNVNVLSAAGKSERTDLQKFQTSICLNQ